MTQNRLHEVHFSGVPETPLQKVTLSIGIYVLVVFGFLRPITLIFEYVTVYTLSPFEIFGIVISYALLIPVILNFTKLRIDRTTLLVIIFCLYCAQSIIWGSKITDTARLILPFIMFFAARIFITDKKQIGIILIAMVIGYFMPLMLNMYDLISGQGLYRVNYWTGMERFEGSFTGPHAMAYAMLFFSFIFCLLIWIRQINRRLLKYGLFFFLFLSIYCLYKSFTRTAMFGFSIFWLIYFWGGTKKRFFLVMLVCILIAAINIQKIENIFWQTGGKAQIGQHDLNAASSGRLTLWSHNLNVFLDSTTLQKLFGNGLGSEKRGSRPFKAAIWASHNDYLSLLMTLGIIGLLIYLSLLTSLFWEIYRCKLERGAKYLFAGIIISVAVMNFVSNAVIFRIELSQYFWLFMGFFYFAKEKEEIDYPDSAEFIKTHSISYPY